MNNPQIQRDNVTPMGQKTGLGVPALASGSDNGQIAGDMSERIARLEGSFDGLKMAIEGLRHSQNTIIALLGLGFTIILFFLGYLLTRIDSLPTEFERLNQTLTSAITATKQQAPQVIFMPAPVPPPPQVAPKEPGR